MGYYSTFTGRITITPPIPWTQIKNSDYLPGRVTDSDRTVAFEIEETTTETDEGTLTVRRAVALVCVWGNQEIKGYQFDDELGEAVKQHPDRQYAGRIDILGEDGSKWRVKVIDNTHVRRYEPKLVWPEESE